MGVVGLFFNSHSPLRLAGAVLVGVVHDEWAVSDRRHLPESSIPPHANLPPSARADKEMHRTDRTMSNPAPSLA